MADNQRVRIHPSTPFASEKAAAPLSRRPMMRRGCVCRVLCCIFSILFAILLLIVILGLIFYFVYDPKAPSFSVNGIQITDLRLNVDLSLYARFNIRITANNPNKKIGIYYEKGGKMAVWYTKTELCRGTLPAFYQGPLDTKKLAVSLTGQNQYGNALMSALQQQARTGNVPLDLKVDQPVAIRLGSVKLGKVRVLANCKLMVDSLSSTNSISIKTSTCSIRVKL